MERVRSSESAVFNGRTFGNASNVILFFHQPSFSMSLSVHQNIEELQTGLLLMISISHKIICLISSYLKILLNPYSSHRLYGSYVTCAKMYIEANLILSSYKRLDTYEIYMALFLKAIVYFCFQGELHIHITFLQHRYFNFFSV